MDRHKITGWQFALTLSVARMFSIVTYTPMNSQRVESTALVLGALVSTFMVLIVMLPVFLLLRKQNTDIVTVAFDHSKVVGYIVGYGYFFGILLEAANTLIHFEFFMQNAIVPDIKSSIILITLFLAGIYGAFMGLEGIARTGSIFCLVFAIALFMVYLFSFSRIELVHLKPLINEPVKSVLNVAWGDTTRNIEILLLIILFPHVKGRFFAATGKYLLLTAVGLLFVSFITTVILGDYLFQQVFPFFTIATVVNLESVRRLDAVYMMIWTVAALIRVTLYLYTANILLQRLLPYKLKKLSVLIIGVIVLVSSLFVSRSIYYTSIIYEFVSNGVVLLLLAVLIPLILLLLSKLKQAKRGEPNG